MKRGISLIILLLCALCLQAQSDLTWIRTKEGRMVAQTGSFRLEPAQIHIQKFHAIGQATDRSQVA